MVKCGDDTEAMTANGLAALVRGVELRDGIKAKPAVQLTSVHATVMECPRR